MPSIEWTTNPQYTAPAAANGTTITPNAVSWTNSAWFELLASAPADLLVTGLSVGIGNQGEPFAFDLGVGGAGAESVITTFRGQFRGTLHGPVYLPHVIPVDAVPSGSRVAARMRKNGTSVLTWTAALTYLRKPITGTLTTTTKPQQAAPVDATLTVTSPASAWTNGSWATVLASAGADLVIVGVVIPALTSSADWEVDLGVGAAASESVITTFAGRRSGFTDGPCFFPLANPLDVVTSGQRVAARIRTSGAAAVNTTVAIVYHEKPL